MIESEVHTVADNIAVIVSLPLLVTMATIMAFAFRVKNTADSTAAALKEYAKVVSKTLEDHGDELEIQGKKVAVLWDGHERRHGVNDRRNT